VGSLGWLGRDVITVLDFKREDLEVLFTEALNMEKYAKSRLDILNGKVLALAFFEPSTRTRLSFETAMLRLGGSVIGFSGTEATSMAKGENLADTIRMLDSYANAIVIRHSLEGAARVCG
jgi:aspartate carbamoyltransferase (EC 2.1.3.2)